MRHIPAPAGECVTFNVKFAGECIGKFLWPAVFLLSLLPLMTACSSGPRFLSDAAIADGSDTSSTAKHLNASIGNKISDADPASQKRVDLSGATSSHDGLALSNEQKRKKAVSTSKSDAKQDAAEKENAEEEADRRFYAEYSEKFGVELTGEEDKYLLMELENWLGAPYRWGGCSPRGVDCSCLVKEVFQAVYGTDMARTVSAMLRQNDLESVHQTELNAGDLVFFRTKGKRINHMGIYLADGAFVHASRSSGVRVSRLNAPYYRRVFAKAERHENMMLGSAASRLHIGELVIQ